MCGQGAIRAGRSWYFAQFDRNKKSLTLDLCTYLKGSQNCAVPPEVDLARHQSVVIWCKQFAT